MLQCFTILWQQPGVQALQVLNSKKQWIEAPPIDGTLVIKWSDLLLNIFQWLIDLYKPGWPIYQVDKYVFRTIPWHHLSVQFLDDIFKSTVHRAVNRNGVDRYSIPLFFGTDYDVNIEVRACLLAEYSAIEIFEQPIASCVSAERPARYGPVLAGEYVNQRLKEMYY
jgi:hypothetical protein